jgi:hypothetical protein
MKRTALLGLCALLALAALMVFTPSARADQHDEYEQAYTRAYNLLTDAMLADTPEAEQQLRAEAADALAAIDELALADGNRIRLDNKTLIDAIRDPDMPLDEAITRVETLATALSQFKPKDGNDAAAGLARVRGDVTQDWWRATLERLVRALAELLAPLFRGTSDAIGGIVSSRLFIVGGVILLAGVAIYFGRNLFSNLSAESSVAQPEAESDVPASFRTAVRQLYLGTLLILDERGKLKFDRALTNRETVRAVRNAGASALADNLRPIVDYYDGVWYGFARVEQGDYERYRAQVEAVKSA